MGIDENLQDSIRRKLEGFLTAEEAEAVMTELNAPSVDEQFSALHAMLVSRFDQIDARFDGVDARFDRVEARLDDHDRRFDEVDTKLLELDLRTASTATAIGKLEFNEDRIATRVDANNERIDKLAYWLIWAVIALMGSIIAGIGMAIAIAG